LYDFGFVHKELVAYLNHQHAQGRRVVIFSTAPSEVAETVRGLGLHPDLVERIQKKRFYQNAVLETLIDDDPPGYLTAQTVWDPTSDAFRNFMAAAMLQPSSSKPQHIPAPEGRRPS
jgi:hypothetical protein